jgi:cyclic beta-1,2-glucan synthetase
MNVLCQDPTPLLTGRGGWTWYTGAAGWMYRLTVETLLGLNLEGDHLRIAPCIPAHWESYKIQYRYRDTVYHISIKRVSDMLAHAIRVTLDGVVINGADESGQPPGTIPLVDDRQDHHVEVALSKMQGK